MFTVDESRWKNMPVFGRFDGSECVKFFAVAKFSFLSPTRRSLGETPSIRFRLITMDSSDDLPGLMPEVAATSKLKSIGFYLGSKQTLPSYFGMADKQIDHHSYQVLVLVLSSHRY